MQSIETVFSELFYILCFILSIPNLVYILYLNSLSHSRLNTFQVLDFATYDWGLIVLDRASLDLAVFMWPLYFIIKPLYTLRSQICKSRVFSKLFTLCLTFLICKMRIIVFLSGFLWGCNKIMHVNCSRYRISNNKCFLIMFIFYTFENILYVCVVQCYIHRAMRCMWFYFSLKQDSWIVESTNKKLSIHGRM